MILGDPNAFDLRGDPLRDAFARGVDEAVACFPGQRETRRIGLHDFIVEGWHTVEPHTQFEDNWHIREICEHLEAVTAGDIERLIINIPTRCCKSTLVSVFWHPWVWTQDPWSDWLTGSYDEELSTRDAERSQTILLSPWYQRQWGHVFRPSRRQWEKSHYLNSEMGRRLAVAVGTKGVGFGGHYIVADDSLNPRDIYSPTKVKGSHDWWRHRMTSRANDPRKKAFVVMGQRLIVDDLPGVLMEQGDYVHLVRSQEYDPKIFDLLPKGKPSPIPCRDPRTKPGELMWSSRFTQTAIDEMKRDLQDFGFAAQQQQYPVPAEGGMVKAHQIQEWSIPDLGINPRPDLVFEYIQPETVQIHVDARTKEDPTSGSYAVVAVWGRKDGCAYLLDMWRERAGYDPTEQAVESMIKRWPMARRKVVEAKAAGPIVVQKLKAKHRGFEEYNPGQDNKISRLDAQIDHFRAHNVYIPAEKHYTWVKDVRFELTHFPFCSNDDIVDTTSQALLHLFESNAMIDRYRRGLGRLRKR